MMKNHRLTNVTAIMTIFVVLILSLFPCGSSAAGNEGVETHTEVSSYHGVPQSAAKNLILAYNIGQEILGAPETLQAIMLQESRGVAGLVGNKSAPPRQRSYGLMQVQIPTARSVLRDHTEVLAEYFPNRQIRSVNDQEIERLLMKDNEANIRIAAHHFKFDLTTARGNWDRAVASYNLGIGGVMHIRSPATFPYVVGVREYLRRVVRPFNMRYKATLSPTE